MELAEKMEPGQKQRKRKRQSSETVSAGLQLEFKFSSAVKFFFLSNTFFHSHTSVFVANLSDISKICTAYMQLSGYFRRLQSKHQY